MKSIIDGLTSFDVVRNSQHATQLPSLDEATDMLRFTFAATAQDASKAEFLKRVSARGHTASVPPCELNAE